MVEEIYLNIPKKVKKITKLGTVALKSANEKSISIANLDFCVKVKYLIFYGFFDFLDRSTQQQCHDK